VMNNSEIPKRKPTDQTVFPIASVSKVFTVSYLIEAARCVLNFIFYISHATTVGFKKVSPRPPIAMPTTHSTRAVQTFVTASDLAKFNKADMTR